MYVTLDSFNIWRSSPRTTLITIYKAFIRPIFTMLISCALKLLMDRLNKSRCWLVKTGLWKWASWIFLQLDSCQILAILDSSKSSHSLIHNSFFPSAIVQWNNLDLRLTKSESFSVFITNFLMFIRTSSKFVYHCHNSRGICLIKRLRLALGRLREQKFKQSTL